MTEAEWLTATEVSKLLVYLRGEVEPNATDEFGINRIGDVCFGPAAHTTEARLAAFALECCRRWWELPLEKSSAELIRTYERYLNGTGTYDEFTNACVALPSAVDRRFVCLSSLHMIECSLTPYGVMRLTQHLAWVTCTHAHREQIEELERTATEDDLFAWGFFGYDFPEFNETAEQVFARFPVLLREVIGNPFRPVAFDPAWRTSDAIALARQMYDSREFGAMPILADALQDAGCDSEELLNHCRDATAVHVRGCWVCDRVLGKE